MSTPTDGLILENDKENIQPLVEGRSAAKLARNFEVSARSSSNHKEELKLQRQRFQEKLKQLDELDDPLQVFLDYIKWIHESYPSGASTESGLLTILENCTSNFRDVQYYKNDPRYLKVWLEYAEYSDDPKDIFVYLAKKEIGRDLALYYEEFAKHLELNGNLENAEEVYTTGISRGARPVGRLERNYFSFKRRSKELSSLTASERVALTLKEGEDRPLSRMCEPRKKQRIQIYNDNSPSRSIFSEVDDIPHPGFVKSRTKENRMLARSWNGEILKQNIESASNKTKIPVFKDDEHIIDESPSGEEFKITKDLNGRTCTMIDNPGKAREIVQLNMSLLYSREKGEEYSMLEILAMNRLKSSSVGKAIVHEVKNEISSNNDTNSDRKPIEDFQKEHTLTIPLNDIENVSSHKSDAHPNSPTMTFYSKMASNEVMNLFSAAGQGYNSETEDSKIETDNTTNYDGFVTETIHAPSHLTNEGDFQVEITNAHSNANENLIPMVCKRSVTPEPQKEDFHERDTSPTSSPFVEQPSLSQSHDNKIYDPLDYKMREYLLKNMRIPLKSYVGYHEYPDTVSSQLKNIMSMIKKGTQATRNKGRNCVIKLSSDVTFCVRCELGRGGYGVVYLVETEEGNLKALKLESPSSRWEFYILTQIHKRFRDNNIISGKMVVKPESLYFFKDESYLVMEYITQGTLLDVVNLFKLKGLPFDEVLCMFLTVDLLKLIEDLHYIGIVHGDLKADNCMVSLHNRSRLSNFYNVDPESNWAYGNVVLIDFGRAIDMRIYGEDAQFVSTWKCDSQDCPEMHNGKPWSYEADYYGLACIIHTMLFGSYIDITQDPKEQKIRIRGNLKRYWQVDLWSSLFETLLNPYTAFDSLRKKTPIVENIRKQRYKFESWLVKYGSKRDLKKALMNIEQDLEVRHSKLVSIFR